MIFDNYFPLQFAGGRQWEIFSLACLLGIVLGAVYDVIRAVRRGLHLGNIPEQIMDFLFAVFFFFCFFVFSVAQTGDLRFFTLLAVLLGAASERYTLGRLTLPLMTALFSGLRLVWAKTGGRAFANIIQKTRSCFVENKSKLKNLKKSSKRS